MALHINMYAVCCFQFSDFKRFADNIADEVADKKVLMYCTGESVLDSFAQRVLI